MNSNCNQNPKKPIPKELIGKILDKLAPLSAPNLLSCSSFGFQPTVYTLKSFTIHELEFATKHSRNTVPGLDGFTYKIIQMLALSVELFPLQIFHDWWVKQEYCDDLKNIIIGLLLKANQDAESASSYRPISLLSCTTKSFERLIKFRLEYFLGSSSILPRTQLGFRRGLGSTADAVGADIQICFSNNQYTGLQDSFSI